MYDFIPEFTVRKCLPLTDDVKSTIDSIIYRFSSLYGLINPNVYLLPTDLLFLTFQTPEGMRAKCAYLTNKIVTYENHFDERLEKRRVTTELLKKMAYKIGVASYRWWIIRGYVRERNYIMAGGKIGIEVRELLLNEFK